MRTWWLLVLMAVALPALASADPTRRFAGVLKQEMHANQTLAAALHRVEAGRKPTWGQRRFLRGHRPMILEEISAAQRVVLGLEKTPLNCWRQGRPWMWAIENLRRHDQALGLLTEARALELDMEARQAAFTIFGRMSEAIDDLASQGMNVRIGAGSARYEELMREIGASASEGGHEALAHVYKDANERATELRPDLRARWLKADQQLSEMQRARTAP
jgi:hypothetical protein